ncbi:MAG TPA: Hpt domain-containing protein, partial [Anaeromyxobacteraceae bacterium]|nr:Hpt domain-containing protein [Anaeromyxobacteraceae bacterium]
MALDLAKYLSLYLAEAGEHLAAFSSDLVKLEQALSGEDDARPVIDSLFRHVHSVKGMSASMAFEPTAALAHKAEDLVDVFRKGIGRFEPWVLDVLFDACDALQDMVAESAAGKPAPRPELEERLAEATRKARAPAGTRGDDAPAPPPEAARAAAPAAPPP